MSPNPALFALYYLAVCDDGNVPQHTGGECNVFNNEWVRENKQTWTPERHRALPSFAYALTPTTASPRKQAAAREFEPRRHELSSVCGFPHVSAKLSSPSSQRLAGRGDRVKLMDTKQEKTTCRTGQHPQPTPALYLIHRRSGVTGEGGGCLWRLQQTSCAGNIPRW